MALCGCDSGALAALGVECSTFVAINKGTSKRDMFNPWGDDSKPSVQQANQATSRQSTRAVACGKCIERDRDIEIDECM